MRVLGSATAVLVLVAVALAAPGVVGAAAWSAPETLSAPGEENTRADVAVGPDGTTIAVWQRAECTGSSEMHQCETGLVQYSVRPPAGGFSEPVDMPGDPFGSINAVPRVAVDGAGNAIAIWSSGAGELARLRYSLRPAGGAFGGAKTLLDPVGSSHSFPSLAMAADGRAVVTFLRSVGGMIRASYAVRAPGGEFGAAQSMAGDPGTLVNQAPEVHLGAGGEAIANWASHSVAGVQLRYAVLPAGGVEFGSTQTIEDGSGARLAMAPSGAAALLWNVSGSADDLRYAFRPAGGLFGPPQTLLEPDGPLAPRVAIAPDGTTLAAWSSLIGGKTFARWTTAPFGGPFGAPTPLTSAGASGVNDLEMSDRGIALALWVDQSGPPLEARASLRPPGGPFGEPAPLSTPAPGAAPAGGVAAFSRGGDYAAALWTGRDLEGPETHDVPLRGAFLDATEAVEQVVATSASASPSIDGLRVSPRRFRVGRAATARVSRRGGTTIRFRLSGPADVRLQVQRRRPGVRVRSAGRVRCLPATARNRQRSVRKRRCVRFKRVGAPLLRRSLPAGDNRVAFSGRIGRRALRRGPHRIVAVATNQAGQSSQPRRAGFRVLRPKRTKSRDKAN